MDQAWFPSNIWNFENQYILKHLDWKHKSYIWGSTSLLYRLDCITIERGQSKLQIGDLAWSELFFQRWWKFVFHITEVILAWTKPSLCLNMIADSLKHAKKLKFPSLLNTNAICFCPYLKQHFQQVDSFSLMWLWWIKRNLLIKKTSDQWHSNKTLISKMSVFKEVLARQQLSMTELGHSQ
jgi:hypothetical protein